MALVESSHPEQFRLRWALLHSAPAPALRSRRRFGLRACRSGPRKRVRTDRPQDARDDPRGGLFGGRRRWRPWAVGSILDASSDATAAYALNHALAKQDAEDEVA